MSQRDDELDDILKGAARENLQRMGISERSLTPAASNLVTDLRSGEYGGPPEPLLARAADEIERLRAAGEAVLAHFMPTFPDSRAVDDCLVGLAAAVSGVRLAHETSDELEQLRHVYKAAWAYKNAKPGEETIEAYANLDDALWDRKRAEFAENGSED